MRLYTFCNFYLSSIQQGIQSAHLVADMFVKYRDPSPERVALQTWAKNHKTMIVLNGGNSEDLNSLFLSFRGACSDAGYPYEVFSEDYVSLNRATTCVGVIVGEKIWTYNEFERAQMMINDSPFGFPLHINPTKLTDEEKVIANIIAGASLAR